MASKESFLRSSIHYVIDANTDAIVWKKYSQ
jgi:hypothetical protein